MAGTRTILCGAGLVLTLALAGCIDAAGKSGKSPGVGAIAGADSASRDVEAPDVFQMSGPALWDGRPSLGGVWVAHSAVKDPERVMIRNEKNGKSVVGALFRREREQPGPAIQVSSDAAEELGMLAGAPSDLSIVVLRRQEVAEEPAQASAEVTETGTDTQAQDQQASDADTAVAPEADDSSASDAADATTVGAAAAGATGATAGATEVPKKKGFFARLFGAKPKPDSGAEAVASGVTVGAIEQAPLDPVVASASAGIAAAEASQAASAAASAPTLKRAFVQIGIFSNQANAAGAAKQMQAAGMSASVVPDAINGKPYWRVIVGPAASVADRDALAAKVRGIGYPDAYPVSQ